MNLESCFKGFEKTFENLDVVFEMYSPILKKMDTACFAELGNLSEEFDYSMEEFDNYGKNGYGRKILYIPIKLKSLLMFLKLHVLFLMVNFQI